VEAIMSRRGPGSSNGRTPAFGAENRGSSPCPGVPSGRQRGGGRLRLFPRFPALQSRFQLRGGRLDPFSGPAVLHSDPEAAPPRPPRQLNGSPLAAALVVPVDAAGIARERSFQCQAQLLSGAA